MDLILGFVPRGCLCGSHSRICSKRSSEWISFWNVFQEVICVDLILGFVPRGCLSGSILGFVPRGHLSGSHSRICSKGSSKWISF